MSVISTEEREALAALDVARRGLAGTQADAIGCDQDGARFGYLTAAALETIADAALEAVGIEVDQLDVETIGCTIRVTFVWRWREDADGWAKFFRSDPVSIQLPIEAGISSTGMVTKARKMFKAQHLRMRVLPDPQAELANETATARETVRGATRKMLATYCAAAKRDASSVITAATGVDPQGRPASFDMLAPSLVGMLYCCLLAWAGPGAGPDWDPNEEDAEAKEA